MQLDAWFSMVVFTVATVSFYLLDAAVLHLQGLDPKGPDPRPSRGCTSSRSKALRWAGSGPSRRSAFLLGAWAVLFKTLYVATAANSRLTVDFLHLVGRLAAPDRVRRAASEWSSSSACSTRRSRSACTTRSASPRH